MVHRIARKNIARLVFSFLSGLLTAGLSAIAVSLPVKAAEEIVLVYSPLALSVPVASLETFARTGEADRSLRTYLQWASAEQKAQFREALLKRVDIDPVLLSRLFNSAMGSDLLYRLGKAITIQGGINGKYALRGAIVSAALDKEEGLTVLNVLKKFPTNIQLQGELLLGLVRTIDYAVRAAETFAGKMREWTVAEAAAVQPPNCLRQRCAPDYATLPDLRKPGKFEVQKEVWNLTDKSRERSLYVDVYIPKTSPENAIPVVIFSHGLASSPEDFAKGLENLASHGFLVAAPQHPGSDARYLKGMLAGYYRNIFDRDEFINRPKDISFVIDELERRNASRFGGKLGLTNVGVAGHSFGGYTVLAIAGAQIDFEHLEKDCQRMGFGLNLAILLQCRALELPRQVDNFRDDRVSAVFAANPVNRSIFGPVGLGKITVPVLLASGSYDPATNPIFEQAASFTWLKTPDKYLAMLEGQAHVNFTQLDAGLQTALDSVGELTLPSQDLIGSYAGPLLVSFFQVYTARNENYRPFLRSAYAEYLGEKQPFRLDFISAASAEELAELIQRLRDEF